LNKWRGSLLAIVLLLFFPNYVKAEITPVSHNVSVSGTVRDTTVTFMGYTSPNAYIIIQEDAAVVASFSANSAGGFNRTLTARIPGTHSYGIYATDEQNRTTPTYGFVLNLLVRTETTVSNILLPTTIDVTVPSGANIFGSSYPTSQVTIFVHSDPTTESVIVPGNGDWSRMFNGLSQGHHSAYARVSTTGGLQSMNSNTVEFDISCTFGLSDLNGDTRVELTDFSILMYYWGTSHLPGDINCDGTIDLTDFSIMMYHWTG
jgi:hypothetical protein